MNFFKLKKLLSMVVVLGSLFFAIGNVDASDPKPTIRDEAYSARYESQSIPDPIEIEAGETKTVEFKFKNTGTATWNNTGSRYISAYTMEPRYRNSEFKGPNWISAKQTAKMTGTIKPGEVGTLKLQLTAPEELGEYTEEFYLAAENYSWMKGGYFYIKTKVVPKVEKIEVVVDENAKVDEVVNETTYKVKRMGLSKKTVEAIGGERIKLVVIYKNVGDVIWPNYKLVHGGEVKLASIDKNEVNFSDNAWLNETMVFSTNKQVKPDGLTRETFYIRAPAKKGNYVFLAQLKAGDELLDEAVTVSVHVTENAPLNYAPPNFDNSSDNDEDLDAPDVVVKNDPRFGEEPHIRVGIQSVGKDEQKVLYFISYEDDYVVKDGIKKIDILPKGVRAVLKYEAGVYSFKSGGIAFNTNQYIRLEPETDQHAVFKIVNMDRNISWVGTSKFNQYRGAMEYRRGQTDEELYVVNDLLFEDYVKGVRETGSNAPIEMVKANLVAARTYAFVSRGKYPFFDVVGSTYDQLYLGYESELAIPNVVEAVEATRGMMVTYRDEIVVTPYFGNSNGYTRSWTSAWGGSEKPWLVPVRCEYDSGRARFGHGVGMSQRDAAVRADEKGSNFVELLKHYYTGVRIEKMYN